MKKRKVSWHFAVLILLILAYFAVFSYFTVQRYNAYVPAAYDLGVWTQTLWNAAHGNGFVNSIEFLPHFGLHVNLILIPFVPLYWLFGTPVFLLMLQSAMLAIGALPLYLLAVMKLKNKIAGLVFAAVYLLYPSLHNINLFDFHAIALVIPFLLFMFYFFEKKNYRAMFMFAVLALSCKEDVALVVLFFGLYVLLIRKLRKIGVAVACLALLWLIMSFFVIIPSYGSSFELSSDNRYSKFGNTLTEVAVNVIAKPGLTLSTLFSPGFS